MLRRFFSRLKIIGYSLGIWILFVVLCYFLGVTVMGMLSTLLVIAACISMIYTALMQRKIYTFMTGGDIVARYRRRNNDSSGDSRDNDNNGNSECSESAE